MSAVPECDMPLKSPSRPSTDRRRCDGRQGGTAAGAERACAAIITLNNGMVRLLHGPHILAWRGVNAG
jgi:hypothetical protein